MLRDEFRVVVSLIVQKGICMSSSKKFVVKCQSSPSVTALLCST